MTQGKDGKTWTEDEQRKDITKQTQKMVSAKEIMKYSC
jgi:hypothetical protein